MSHQKRIILGGVVMIAVIATAAFAAQAPARFFDTAQAPQGKVRLAVFYPSVGSLKALIAVKDQGFIPYADWEIVGVHHERERTNYAEAEKFVKDNNLDWIHFHTIQADIGLDSLYKKNAASAELEKIFDLSSGIVFNGGPDIVPAAYGEEMSLHTVVTDPYRHYIELTAIFHLLGGSQDPAFKAYLEKRPDFPILGICLGMQSLNVGTGGTLIQDIWSESYFARTVQDAIRLGSFAWHTNPYPKLAPLEKSLIPYMLHPIRLAETGKLVVALGMKPDALPYVMSAHHQSAEKIGKGFKVIATSVDGKVVEAIEHEKYPNVLGVQFHPEFPMLWDATPKYKVAPDDKNLFACRTILEKNPPSFEFHKKLWGWFFAALKK
ncbi:MAG: gamma-glutamyl-gamma-aminobutyrate hydrolase family protein [Candidatus Aminicenantes bacterium]|nr:gamma-glutamyl-gamma-aminobutyrate hydrolase family protein [Candidatus Aminicenantes bacterium]